MRKFIVLHSAENWNLGKPIAVFIDKICYITPNIIDSMNKDMEDKKEEGTTLLVDNAEWIIDVREPMDEVLQKIRECEEEE